MIVAIIIIAVAILMVGCFLVGWAACAINGGKSDYHERERRNARALDDRSDYFVTESLQDIIILPKEEDEQ